MQSDVIRRLPSQSQWPRRQLRGTPVSSDGRRSPLRSSAGCPPPARSRSAQCRGTLPALAQLSHQVVPAAVRQPEVADQQVEGLLAGQLQCRGHVAGRFDRVAAEVSTIRIIFAVTPWSSTSRIRKGRTARDPQRRSRAARAFGPAGGRRQRQADAERRSLAPALAVGLDPAAVHLHHRLADRQPQSQAAELPA